jgi:glycosyltransferase involved in cell wall biosynthesis
MSNTDTKATPRIRIAFLIDTIDYQSGGTEHQLVLLLRRLDRTRFEPTLCCLLDSSWLQANRDLCPIHIVDFRSFFSLRSYLYLFRFARYLRHNRFDILQSYFRDSNIVATLAGRLAGVDAIVATRRNLGYWQNRVELALLRLLNPFSTHFLVNAHAIRRHTENVEGVPSVKIETIYNGLLLDDFGRDRENTRDKQRAALGIGSNTPLVTIVGNLRPVKGVDVFLRAARHVLDRYPQVHFLIVGEGPERGRLTALIHSLNIASSVHLLGKRSDVSRLLAASDIGALSSHSEGLSNAVIECMAAGLPVVCTDVGGNPELVQDGVSGYLVPPGDSVAFARALLRLLEHPDDIKRMGMYAQTRTRELFDIDTCVERTESFYQRAVTDRPASRRWA